MNIINGNPHTLFEFKLIIFSNGYYFYILFHTSKAIFLVGTVFTFLLEPNIRGEQKIYETRESAPKGIGLLKR